MIIVIFLLSLLVEWPDDKLNIIVNLYPVFEGYVFKNVYWIIECVIYKYNIKRLQLHIFALYLILQTYNLCECFSKKNHIFIIPYN